ncbi:exopolysaccharide production protein ExoZ [Mesorhizobium sp. NFR06]|uniref:acyltransferase family protein n=1 Tax=Mesorhizobium sp. NFR06 TaxID=1566290 RepID=UPI0008F1FEDC|nr:acyltransferase [Mesorhizobium sp. NFR06]SFO92429.1 exopolysaccharide production protein ExoZ [Mesorhizobium sp. NFR06]
MTSIHSVQYLRGLAACAVVCFHVSEQFGGPFDVGAAGVDVFFVISGFIMWVTTAGRPADPWRFMRRRITRIVPLYWIVTLLTAAGILLKPQFFYGHFFSVQNFVGSLFFLPVLQENALHPIVIQGWTLCYEMMFYLVFTLALFLGERLRFGFLTGALIAIVALHFVLPAGYARAFTDPVVLEFAAGVVVGRLWFQGARLPLGAALAMAVAGFLLLAASPLFAVDMPRALRWGLPATLIVAGAVFAERARPFKPSALPSFLGDASYSIYLWHVVIGVLTTGVVLRIGLPAALQPATILVGTLAFSAMLYLVIEKPLIALLHPQRGKGIVKASGVTAARAAE